MTFCVKKISMPMG